MRLLTLACAAALSACSSSNAVDSSKLIPGGPLACPLPVPVTGKVETPCSQRADERLAAMSDTGIGLTSSLGLAPGRFALPSNAAPTQLVVMFHGHQNDSCSWRQHLQTVAAQGAVAVSMDYHDQEDRVVPPYGLVENWGWAVRSGAEDSISAARYFMNRYPSIKEVFAFGASMGGNVSGLAIYSPDAVRSDCTPLWDWWVVTEGVHNLSEEYLGTRTLNPVLVAAAQAQQEIEEENGGTIEEVPEAYSEITNTVNAGSMAFLKGVVMTHGTSDTTVPVDQSNQMANALRAEGVPTYLYLVQGSDHVWEGDPEKAVTKKALEELARLLAGGTVSDGQTTIPGP